MKRILLPLLILLLQSPLHGNAQVAVQGTSWGTFSSLSSCDYSGSDRDCRIVSTTNGASTQVQWGSTSAYTDFRTPSTLTALDLNIGATTNAYGVVIGQLNWYNSATLRQDSSLDVFSVRWTLGLNFTAPTGSADVNGGELFSLTIRNPINPAGDTIAGLAFADLANLGHSFSLRNVNVSNLRYRVIDGAGPGTSTFSGSTWYNPEYNNASLQILGDFTHLAVATPVPEPETYALLLAGLGLLALRARRRAKA